MALYNIADVREFIVRKNVENVEVYKFNSIKKSVHTDYVDFIGFSTAGFDDDTPVDSYTLMDYEEYNATIEANDSGSFNENEFNQEYPNGILVVVLPYQTKD